jgi:hypothetical protein
MIATLLTVFSAGVLGGALVVNLGAIVVIAAVALALIGIFNGMRTLVRVCELDPRD